MRIGLAAFSTMVLMAVGASAADVSDSEHLMDVMNRRLESQGIGGEVAWLNPSTGNGGVVILLSTDDSDPQAPCRTYRYTIEEPGKPTVVVEGKGCRIADFIWQRSEAQVSLAVGPDPAPSARADPAPTEPPPQFPPPAHKPDPNVFYASIPTPTAY